MPIHKCPRVKELELQKFMDLSLIRGSSAEIVGPRCVVAHLAQLCFGLSVMLWMVVHLELVSLRLGI